MRLWDSLQELGDDDSVCIVGDLNIKDEELGTLCKDLRLRDARYAGVSFGAPGNRFDHSLPKRSFGQRYDRVLCAPKVWAESHLIGNGHVTFEGSKFNLSDHCGVYAYVDVCVSRTHRRRSRTLSQLESVVLCWRTCEMGVSRGNWRK